MAQSSTALPKPKHWEDFEHHMWVLIRCEINNPQTQRHGRLGQKQAGVDIYGERNRTPGHWVGVQCKWKGPNQRVTEKELRAEVRKAQKWQPHPPVEFILATTAARDQAIEAVARTITAELRETGVAMTVHVWGWEDIEERALQHVEALRAFDPNQSHALDEIKAEIGAGLSRSVEQIIQVIEERMAPAVNQPAATQVDTNPVALHTPRHGQITAFVDLINAGHPGPATAQLERLRTTEWSAASASERYRLLVALAAAHLKNGKQHVAGALLLQAYEECPEHPKARQNLAKGHLLNDNWARAQELALSLLERDPSNSDAANTLIQARLHASDAGEPLQHVPIELHDSEDVLMAHIHWLRVRADLGWRDLARYALEVQPQSTRLQLMWAEATLDALTSDRNGVLGGEAITGIDNDAVSRCVSILTTAALEAVTNNYTIAPSLAINAALAARLVDELATAQRILDAAYAQHPDDAQIRLHGAILALVQNAAAKVLQILPADITDPELASLRAMALIEMGEPQQALELLDRLDASTAPPSVQFTLVSARCRAYLTQARHVEAVACGRQASEAAPDSLALHALLVRMLALTDDTEAATVALDRAVTQVTGSTAFGDRCLLALEADRLDRDDVVTNLLDGYVDLRRDSDALRLLIGSALTARAWVRAQQLFAAMPVSLANTQWYHRMRTVLAVNSGHPRALAILEEHLQQWPHDATMVLARMTALLQRGHLESLKEFVTQLDLARLDGGPVTRTRIAALAFRHGESIAALRLAYATLMAHWDQHEVHLAYFGMLVMNKDSTTVPPSMEVVSEDSVVVLADAVGEQRYRIERGQYGAFADERVSPDSDLAQLLLGRRVGDQLDLNRHPGGDPVTIRSILPVYVDAFQRSIEQFNQRFPRASGFWRMTFDESADDPLEAMRTVTRQRAESNEVLLKQYTDGGLPLAFVARTVGLDPIEAWRGLSAVAQPFQVCHGVHTERTQALEMLQRRDRRGCVIDAITLSVIRRVGVLDAVAAVCGTIHSTQSVLDLLGSRALEAQANVGAVKGVVGWHQGQLTIVEYSETTLREWAEDAAAERDWARQHIAVAAAIPRVDLTSETQSIVTMIGVVGADPVLAADGEQLLLLSDDMGLRHWAAGAFQIQASWLQPVLMVALDEGHLTESQYHDALVTMVQGGHHYISLGDNTLTHQAKRDQFELTPALRSLIASIGGPKADLRTNTGVASRFLKAVLEASVEDYSAMRLISAVYDSMTSGHYESQESIVVSITRPLTTLRRWVGEHTVGWLLGHSIGTPQFASVLARSRNIQP